MENNEIKKANRKALPKFLLFSVLCMVIGGVTGYLAARYGLDRMAGTIEVAGDFFGTQIAPWLMVATALAVPILCTPIYRKAKKLLAAWDGEDEDVSAETDRKLSAVIWITSVTLVLSFFLLAASYSGGFLTFDNSERTVILFIGIVAFFVILAEVIIFQQKCVDAAKETNPEKKASVYDMKFQKKWIDDCDEAEKIMIGKCAFKAYSATNAVCAALSIVLTLCALVFGIGFLPSLAVCLIWVINMSVYFRESLRYTRSGNKIS